MQKENAIMAGSFCIKHAGGDFVGTRGLTSYPERKISLYTVDDTVEDAYLSLLIDFEMFWLLRYPIDEFSIIYNDGD